MKRFGRNDFSQRNYPNNYRILIRIFIIFSSNSKAKEQLVDKSKRLLIEENIKLVSELKLFRSVTENILNTHENKIKNAQYAIQQQSQFILKNIMTN
jgi:hypothetical protein